MQPVELHTDRLVLTAPALDDADAITAACQDEELQRRVGVPVPYTRENAVGFVVQWSTAGWEKGTNCTWAMRRNGEFTGIIGLDDIRQGEVTVGYWLARAHRGLGILSEVLPVVLDFAFDPDGLAAERVQWRAYSGNLASARVAQKSGLRFEGIARLGVMGRDGREDDWMAGILSSDDRTPQPWPVLP
jgi:RimJ/RimL family protein N-acetyltransferase